MRPALSPSERAVPLRDCVRENCDRRAIRGREYCNSHWRTWQYNNDPENRASRVAHNRSAQLRNFGLTLEDYDAMMEAQDGLCAICESTTPNKVLAVDHDHACCDTTSRSCGRCVRGLLCLQCNTKLGWFEVHGEAVLDYTSGRWSRSKKSIDSVDLR